LLAAWRKSQRQGALCGKKKENLYDTCHTTFVFFWLSRAPARKNRNIEIFGYYPACHDKSLRALSCGF